MIASVGDDLFRAVLQGAPPGTVYALVALGFVLAYKTSGVFNLAFGAQAYVSAIAYFTMHVEWEWPALPSFVVSVVILAPLLGVILELLVFRHLRTAPPVSGLVVAIGLTVSLPALANVLLDFAPSGGQVPEGLAPRGNAVFYDVGSFYSFSRNELVSMAAAVVAVLVLVAVFRFSSIGLQMRAVVESPRMTELNGINADLVSATAWAMSSFFAGLAGVLIAPRFNSLTSEDFLTIVVVAIAAAAIGSLVSLPRAFAGGLGLGIGIALFNTFMPKWSETFTWLEPIKDNVTPAIPFIVLFSVILFVPSIRKSRAFADPLSGVDPPPTSNNVVDEPRRQLVVRVLAVLAVILIAGQVYFRADAVWIYLVSQAIVLGVIFLSITVITGYAGHISLAQGSFAAIGAFTMFQLADRYDMSVLAGAAVGAVIAAVLAAGLSLLTGRLNGIWIAIATLALAFFFDSVIVKFSWAGGTKEGLSNQMVPRPVIGPWNFADNKKFLVLAVIILVTVYAAVILFGRSDLGRRLAALRGSDVAAQSIGISPTMGRLLAFAVSGALAAFGGSLMAMQAGTVSYDLNFSPFVSLFWLVVVVTFGVRRPSAAILGAMTFTLFTKLILQGDLLAWILGGPERLPGFFPISVSWMMILFGFGTIQYAQHPEGVIDRVRNEIRAKRAARRTSSTAADDQPDDAGSTELETAVNG